jgi:hypothetical protein
MAKKPTRSTTTTDDSGRTPAKATTVADGAERLHVKDLVHDPNQVRRHNQRNLGMLGDGLQKVGAARSIVIDEDNRILAGNGTVEAAGERGITGVRVIEADGHELIAVRRRGLTEAQKVELAIYDNRSSDLAGYDMAALERVTDAFGLERADFFTPVELRALGDREVEHDLTNRMEGGGSGKESTPSIPEGYTAFSVVISEEQNVKLRDVLDRVKDAHQVKTLADALMVVVNSYEPN